MTFNRRLSQVGWLSVFSPDIYYSHHLLVAVFHCVYAEQHLYVVLYINMRGTTAIEPAVTVVPVYVQFSSAHSGV